MKAIWMTDIHLNFLKHKQLEDFYNEMCERVNSANADYVFLTGDIGESKDFENIISNLNARLAKACKILFVLGNHDYYGGGVEDVRKKADDINGVTYLTWRHPIIHGKIDSSNKVMICGIDGFADGRHGSFAKSTVLMNDHVLIRDFSLATYMGNGRNGLIKKMQELADSDAKLLDSKLSEHLDNISHVIVLTHIPPFPEVSKYQGKVAGEEFLPFYTSKATGDVLMSHAIANPSIQYLVLCGHSHHESHFQPLPNLNVYCGKSEYGKPHVQEMVIEL